MLLSDLFKSYLWQKKLNKPPTVTTDHNPVHTAYWWLIGLSLLITLYGLGDRALAGSEDRWADIARNMLITGDWFHPIINGIVYFDKPVVSYWPIVWVARLFGYLNEFIIRLPSALGALIALWATHGIARELFDRNVALFATWMMAGCYGFLIQAHTASADTLNLASIALATLWLTRHRESTRFSAYLVFYLICGIGALTKGLPALVVPIMIALVCAVREGMVVRHLNWKHIIALAIGLGIYYLPFYIAKHTPLPAGYDYPQTIDSGLYLVFKENVVRYFNPFDHQDPVYSYLYQVPRILFPWFLLFVYALINQLISYRSLNRNQTFLLDTIVIIFIFFTLSGSRRWYYILPILPFCIIQTAYVFNQNSNTPLKKWLTRLTFTLLAFCFALLITSIVVLLDIHLLDNEYIYLITATCLLGSAIVAMARWRESWINRITGLPGNRGTLVLLSLVLLGGVFGPIWNQFDSFRTHKSFALELKQRIKPDQKIVSYQKPPTDIVFYLDLPKPIAGVQQLSDLANTQYDTVLIIPYKNQDQLFRVFPALKDRKPMLVQQQYNWAKKQEEPVLSAWLITSNLAGNTRPGGKGD